MTRPPNPGPYPYQPPPQYAPPPPKKKGGLKKAFALGCGIPLGVVVLIVIIAIATSGGRQAAKDDSQKGLGSSSGAPVTASQASPPPTTTTPPPPPKVYTGKGDSVVQIDAPKGLAIVAFECPSCTGNTVVKSDGPESLLVNTIGAYNGKRWINARAGGVTNELTVNAKGSWTITVGGFDLARGSADTAAVTGSGDDVVLFAGRFRTAAVSNKGKGNFVVETIPVSSKIHDLAVNEIGSYEGTVKLPAPALVQVTSSGDWTITPQG